jgi:DNA modification methylase
MSNNDVDDGETLLVVQYGRVVKDMHNCGWSIEAIATKFSRSVAFVTTVLDVQALPELLQQLIVTGKLAIADAVAAHEATDHDTDRLISRLCAIPALASSIDELTKIRQPAVYMGDCLPILKQHRARHIFYDAIITDPPYEIGMHGKAWDKTGISFSAALWDRLFAVLKPGGFVAAFSTPRNYHHLAYAAEAAGFELYPFLSWRYPSGVPKPTNLSELFDRDNIENRNLLGHRPGSGYTRANAEQGMQNRFTTRFPIYERHVSKESQEWKGYFYSPTCMMPNSEPILLAQKPREFVRMIDNIRTWGTGALNLGAMQKRYPGSWPTMEFVHSRQNNDHGSDHPTVKPVKLMEDLCLLLCPSGGTLLDPFAGTGTTGVAAQQVKLNCVLIEQEEKMRAVIARRIPNAIFRSLPEDGFT